MQAVDAPARPLQLYNPDGSLRVPEDMLDRLDEQFGDKRVFSYQIPHMDDAKKYFERNPALVYEPTRFDQYWTPDARCAHCAAEQDGRGDHQGSEGEGSRHEWIFLHGLQDIDPGARRRLPASLTNGADWNGPQDDPNTLNPEEDRQCAAWWQQIVDARTQDTWRATRKLYDSECRKPKERRAAG